MADFQAESPQASEPGDEVPWQGLPPELLTRILARLPTNEVPCTARLVCKAVAAALSSPAHTTVRLSQPSPHGEFACRWGAPGAMRALTFNRRHRLLRLTAASGCLHNLAWLMERVGCSPDGPVLGAAAAAGRLEACRWLLLQGYDGLPAVLAAAAGAGQRSTLEALLADPSAQDRDLDSHLGPGHCATIAIDAARGGHACLVDWLLERFPLPSDACYEYQLLAAAATSCDLPTLQRLHLARQPQLAQLEQARPGYLRRLLGPAAASSPTPDWKAKVEWLEACLGAPLDDTACIGAAACPDALVRLGWLRARGCPWDAQATTSAAGAGNVEALSYLLAGGCEVEISALRAAAAGGHLAALEVLHSHGHTATYPEAWAYVAAAAARLGQLPVVRWMLERQLIELQPPGPGSGCYTLLGAAAQSGSVELLALLHAGGCTWREDDVCAAAWGGCEEALEWAVARGCPVQELDDNYEDPYLIAARRDDWHTLACLRRLAVPWRPLNRDGGTFAGAVRQGCGVPILRRLLELGCPVDWVRAMEEASPEDQDYQEVRSWLKEEKERRTEVEGAPQRL